MAHRVDLRECAAIGCGIRKVATRDGSGRNPLDYRLAAIKAIGNEAAAMLAAIPDNAALQASDRAFLAAHPLAADRRRGALVRRLRRVIERYREECGLDQLGARLAVAEAYARIVRRLSSGGAPA